MTDKELTCRPGLRTGERSIRTCGVRVKGCGEEQGLRLTECCRSADDR